MARRRSVMEPVPFKWEDGETINTPLVGNKTPPGGAMLNAELMRSDDKRNRAAYVLSQLAKDFLECSMVNSDSELIERVDEYFRVSAERRITPTVEGMCLYCGYSKGVWAGWCTGQLELKHDIPGVNTINVAQKAKTLLASYDGTLALEGQINTLAYIFRSRNYYDMTNNDVTTIDINIQNPSLPREEIAKRIADISTDIDTEYDVH